MNIFQVFQETCQANPDKVCLKFKKGEEYHSLTYSQLYEKVLRLKYLLIKLGIKPGERIAILLSNGPYWPVAFFAGVSLQAVVVPVDIQLSPDAIKGILIHSESKLVLTEEKFGVSLGEIFSGEIAGRALFLDRQDWSAKNKGEDTRPLLSSFKDHKLAALFYTSGTTQEHKAVMLTHKNLLSNFYSIYKLNILKKDDVIVSLLPLHHTYPFMVTCLAPLLEGATVCYLATMVHHELFSCIKQNKVTVFVAVPQLFSLMERALSDRLKKYGFVVSWTAHRLIDLCAGLSAVSGSNISKKVLKRLHAGFGEHLKMMITGGAKLDPGIARTFHRLGFRIIEGYGLTETSPVVTFNPMNSAKFDSVGKPLPGVEVRIINAGKDGIGEIAVRGENVMLGYYRASALTKKAFQDGWFLTGDSGFKDKEGYLHITGRMDELIVLPSGKKINPEEIEAHYLKSPFIKEICVLYVKSGPESGHLAAVVVPDEDYLKLKKHINIHFKIHWELDSYSQKLPPYERIKGFVLTSEALPRTRLGKLIRYKISEKFSAGAFKEEAEKAVMPEKLSNFEEMALQYISKILKKDVRIDDHLELDLGLDSLGRIELLSSLQDVVNVGIDDSLALELFQARSIRELITKACQALPQDAFRGFLKREDTIFWSEALKEPLSKETRAKLKLHFDFFDKLVSLIEILILKFFFRVIFSLTVKGRENIPKAGPFVVVSNHVSYLDAFYVVCALPYKMLLNTYFVGFGDIFNHPLISWAVRFNRLIPIDTNLNLAETLRACSYVLEKGKILVYFPEGQRSIDGKPKEFRKGIGILAKEANVRILPVYLEGAYKAWPRTRPLPLPSPVTVKIGGCLEVSRLPLREGEDPYVAIAESLKEKISELEKAPLH